MNELGMEIREINESERVVVGRIAPYDEVSYLVPDPNGERILRGAFKRSIQHRGTKIPLYRNHDHAHTMGYSTRFDDGPDGLVATFTINGGTKGDDFLDDLRNGYMAGLSAGFTVPNDGARRGADGVREVREAKLVEVSAVGLPAYEGASLLAVRNAQNLDEILAGFANPPAVNLAPIPPIVHTPR